jgi:hypothetical protein
MGQSMTKTITAFGFLACLAGCYNTLNVKNGGLVCGPNDACPDKFTCIKDGADGQSGHCWRDGTGPDAGGNKTDASAPKTDVANPLTCTTPDPNGVFGPFAACSPELPGTDSSCDPVCQSGCPCDRRCVVNETTWASFECEAAAQAPATFVPVQGDCGASRSASCAPGSICISDDFCPWLCYRACRKDTDCPKDSRCSGNTLYDISSQPVSGVFLCTPPVETCNPSGTASCAAPRANFNCVFLAGQTGVANDSTICDCKTLHDKKLGTPCRLQPDDCQPGLVCVDKVCRQICDKQASGSACPNGGGCNPVYGSTRYGYCR